MKRIAALILTLAMLLPVSVFAQQDDCPPGHIRNAAISPLDHDYMVRAFTASFLAIHGRYPSMQPGSGIDDGEYYIAAANHFGVYGDDQCHAGWSGYWESWLEVGHGDLGRVQTPAKFLPSVPAPVPTPAPVPVPVPAPQPIPATDLTPILTQEAINHAAEMAVLQELRTQVGVLKSEVEEFQTQVRSKYVSIMDSPLVRYGLAAISGWLVTRAVNK